MSLKLSINPMPFPGCAQSKQATSGTYFRRVQAGKLQLPCIANCILVRIKDRYAEAVEAQLSLRGVCKTHHEPGPYQVHGSERREHSSAQYIASPVSLQQTRSSRQDQT
jgi:hypothetical protein